MLWKKRRKLNGDQFLEELVELRREVSLIRELLEHLTQKPSSHHEDRSPNSMVVGLEQEKSIEQPVRQDDPQILLTELSRLLETRNLRITHYNLVSASYPLEPELYHLSYFMGRHYPILEPWLSQLRSTLGNPCKTYFSLNDATQEELTTLTNIGIRLYRLRMLESYEYIRSPRALKAQVDHNPDSINYLSGGWFEMGVFHAVKTILRGLNNNVNLVLRDVHLNAAGGGHCQLDIIIYSHNEPLNEQCMVMLECKSSSFLTNEDLQQVRKAVNLLNLGFQRAAVVMPLPPQNGSPDRWMEHTGASIIGFSQISQFLEEALR